MKNQRSGSSSPYSPPVVLSIHGIRTAGKWQKELSDVLGVLSIAHKAHDYGWYGLLRFLRPSWNQRMVDRFNDVYQAMIADRRYDIDLTNPDKRPCVIAHSFGTFIVGRAMEKYEGLIFDKVILCGSILPPDFDWATILGRGQVNQVRNEFGLQDVWSSMAHLAVRDTGASGVRGFTHIGAGVDQKRFDKYRHSDYFSRVHIDQHWVPFLRARPLPWIVRHGRDIQKHELVRLLKQTRAIDSESYSDDPSYAQAELPVGHSDQWIDINPDIYTLATNARTRHVDGYINAMPLKHDPFEELKQGRMTDRDVIAMHILPFSYEQRVKLYLMSIATRPDGSQAGGLLSSAMMKLVSGLFNKLQQLAITKKIVVTELLAVGWRSEGQHLCELLGMGAPIGADPYGHPIYWAKLDRALVSKQRVWSGLRRLIDTYEAEGLLAARP